MNLNDEKPRQTADALLSVRGVKKHFPIREGIFQRLTGSIRAVDGVSFNINRSETVGLVGESGCGKTTLGRCISGLTEPTAGGIFFRLPSSDTEILDGLPVDAELSQRQRAEKERIERSHRIDRMDERGRRDYRRNCQVVFQDSFSSLNPRHLIEDIVARPLRVYREATGGELRRRVAELLESVGLGAQHMRRFPHEFSGGQRQRISIARALALDPDLIILDEPTSALDVSVQAQILNLLDQLQKERGLSYLFISHDLGVIRLMSDRIVVMYLGQVVEEGPAERVFGSPQHPYTKALLNATPQFTDMKRNILRGLDGVVPDPAHPPEGCRFHTRCPVPTPQCGWQVDDALQWLETRALPVEGVKRRSEFEAELAFDGEEKAAMAGRLLTGDNVPEAMRLAVRRADAERHLLHVAFDPVAPMELRSVAESHRSSCIRSLNE